MELEISLALKAGGTSLVTLASKASATGSTTIRGDNFL